MNTFIIGYNKPVMAAIGRPRLILYFIKLSNSGNVCQEDSYGMMIFVDIGWSSVICSQKLKIKSLTSETLFLDVPN